MKTKNVSQPEVQILRAAMLFGLTRRCWPNRATTSNEHVKTDEVLENGTVITQKLTKRARTTVRLIQCEEYDNIVAHLGNTYNWVLARSMLATEIGRGVNFVRRDSLDDIIAKVEEDRKVLRDELLPKFIEKYPKAKEDAKRPVNDQEPERGGLGSLYQEADYPTIEKLRESFDITYRVFALSVPDELPEELREKENHKLRQMFETAQKECLYALREGFKGLVEHAIERLQVKPGEKPKIFVADSMVSGFMEFFDTFRHKNLMDDEELEGVVGKAQDIIMQFAPNAKQVKNSVPLRNQVAAKLTQVGEQLDDLLKDRPVRRFVLD